MKIAFFSDTYIPHKNGVATSLSFLKKTLEEESHSVYLFIPFIPNIPKERNTFTLPSITFPFQKEHRIALPYSIKYDLMLRNMEPNIIHTHTPFSLGIFGLYMGKRIKIPIVHTYHTLLPDYAYYIWDHFPHFVKKNIIDEERAKRIAIWISREYCNHSDLIIAPSTKIKRLLKNFGIQKPIEILPNGIDLDRFKKIPKPEARKSLGLPTDVILLLFVGRLGKEKNIEFLIEVMKYIKENNEKLIYLVIVGDNPDKRVMEELKNKAKTLNVYDRTIFTGYLEYERVIEAYYASDIFVFSSITETQGLVILEAMASGLPVVAIDDDAISDFVKDGINGFLVPNNQENKRLFSEKIKNLIEDKDLYTKMSLHALETSRSFHIKNLNKKLLALYEDLIREYNNSNA
ncbi:MULTISPECIES: glycosyltransferase family 4 protein [Dictyoglomus]|jgi:1,2-diacylglycerol 3-alpha-glucosyltransferase|uniref:Glycosyl transferase group 1 n=1 Tax=Dictyoglomus turgidum (strain DSM 6724 / Z-1310) TaxID=515635 RepID=B8E2Q1_DICTD|nr:MULTISPECIES: glycosyltransferase family 4 protein [Dictyoglomus]ACK42895.1 glycosyl transferase group 1 [Dictyoglomus turgidum DSM 6724]HBU30957.1 glycosyltransferase family 4 protein [Dictyoglomus sp.]